MARRKGRCCGFVLVEELEAAVCDFVTEVVSLAGRLLIAKRLVGGIGARRRDCGELGPLAHAWVMLERHR